jgi:hypothetical protein
MKPFVLGRRTFLRGAGAMVALPTLEAMLNSHGTAFAQGQPLPLRFASYFWGNGCTLANWTPGATGAGWPLTPELQPLAAVQDYVNVVSGHSIKTPNLRGHHNGACAILSGTPFIPLPPNGAPYNSKFGGPSLDQVIAGKIGNTAFKSVQISVSKRVTTGEGPTLQYISHQGPDAPMPPTFSPAAFFNQVFANFTPQSSTDPKNSLRASVLDAVKGDANRLRARLGSADKARLDAHLTAIGDVQTQIMALPPVLTSACQLPNPTPTNDNSDVNGQEQLDAVSHIFSDLIALTWACDLTRVASVQFSGSVGGTVYADVGQVDDEHSLTHDSTRQADVHSAVVYVMQHFGYFLSKLKATPDGTGNLLDNSCILCSTDVCEGLYHSIDDYPILVAGKAGGALKYPGVHYRSNTQENTTNVLLSCAKAVGTGLTSVGGDVGVSSTPCSAILA